MVRRVANQVHKQTARLLETGWAMHEPVWYQAVLDHPPLPLPPRAPPARSANDLPSKAAFGAQPKHMRPRSPRPLPIYYIEDDVRRQFFRDHPFEAYRARSLVEGGEVEEEHTVRGKEWTRLRQRGTTPCSETAIRYAVNLHQHHDLSISKAYASAIAQFRALRAEQEVANATAALEAEAYGGSFGQTEIERNFEREGKALQTWTRGASHLDEGEVAARKRWKAIVERAPNTAGPWSRGAGYTRLWRDGVRPDYAALTQPVSTPPPEPEPSTPAPAQARLSLMESVRRR